MRAVVTLGDESFWDGRRRIVIAVPFPDGQTAMIDVHWDQARDTYAIELCGELIDRSPEAITVATQLAFRAIREHRVGDAR